MPLYTHVVTVELEDDQEAWLESRALVEHLEGGCEVVESRWYRDLDAEVRATLVGIEWGAR